MAERDHLLIAEFNARRSEEAFGALVRMHVDLVFATALRQVGDRGLAEEISQNVFIELAQSAGKLGRHPTISGWLHRTTLNKARERLRSELRRQHREQAAVNLELAKAEGESVWAALVPMLDEALLELRERDRLAVIMHFMEGQTFREIGSLLGVGEDAARKRVNGCLEELAKFFRQRGFVAPAFATGASLFTLSAHAAPAGLATSATTAGLAAAKAAGTSTLALYKLMASTKLKIAAGIIIAAGVGTTILLEHQAQTRLRDDNAALHQQVETLAGDNQRLISQANQLRSQNTDEGKVDSKPKRLSLVEIPAAIRAALKKPLSQHAAAFRGIVGAVDPTDFSQIVKMLETFPNFEAKTTLRTLFLARWTETDAQAALAAAQSTADAQNRQKAVLAVAKSWAKNDFDASLTWAQQLPASQDSSEILQNVIATLAETDPQKAATLALEMPGRSRMVTARQVAEQWVQRDPDGLMAWLAGLPPGYVRTEVLTDISRSLAQANPQKAAELLGSLPPSRRTHFLDDIASSWAQDDLAGALDWAERLEGKERKFALISICQQWAETDPKAAAVYIQKTRPDVLYTVGWHWGANDPQAAIEWANQSAKGEARDDMLNGIFHAWGTSAPLDAANYVTSLPAGSLHDSAAERVVSSWAENDPRAAALWAVSIPEGDARQVAFQNIVLEWGKNDFNATADWLKTLHQNDSRDTAIVTFANNCLKDYGPSTALEWAQTITGDGVRNNSIKTIAQEWLKADEDAAKTWIANSTLPEKIKGDLLRR